MAVVAADIVDAVGTDVNGADVEETSDIEVATEMFVEVADKVVASGAADNFVFCFATLLLLVISHFLSLQHCLNTPGPP